MSHTTLSSEYIRSLPWDLISQIAYTVTLVLVAVAASVALLYLAVKLLLVIAQILQFVLAAVGAYHCFFAVSEFMRHNDLTITQEKSHWWAVSASNYIKDLTSYYMGAFSKQQ